MSKSGRRINDVDIGESSRVEGPDDYTILAMEEASPALKEWWNKSPGKYRSDRPTRRGVKWSGSNSSDDRVLELDLGGCPLEALPPEIGQLKVLTKLDLSGSKLATLPLEIGQLKALTEFDLRDCLQLILAPGAEVGQPAQTIVAAYAPLLIVEPRKDTPGQLHAFLLANPLAVPPFFKIILTDAAHAVWLGEAVKAAPSLAGLTDAEGRRAIVVTHSRSGIALGSASEELKADQETVRIAVAKNGFALQFASDGLEADRETVRIAVTQNGLALQFASEDLKADRAIVRIAVKQRMNKADWDVAKDSEHCLMDKGEHRRWGTIPCASLCILYKTTSHTIRRPTTKLYSQALGHHE